jgi:hypothetical protein
MRNRILSLAIAAIGLGASFVSVQCKAAPSSPSPSEQGAVQAPSRKVNGQVLTSTALPALRMKFDDEFKYVGGHDFILYDVARAEQHFFVDADKQGRIKRMYWVQFEGYLPDNTHSYKYKVNKSVKIGGLDFIADAAPRSAKAGLGRPDSDSNRAVAFLKGKGFRIAGDDLLTQRLVHLIGDAKRDELMIIYIEDMSGTGLTAADLSPGGQAASRWEKLSQSLLDRAVKGIQVLP